MATPTLAVICLELALAFAAGFIIVALMVAPPRECPGARCRQAPGPTTTGARPGEEHSDHGKARR
jgi:hypothetical protein